MLVQILSGISGSGKSTYARSVSGAVIVSADDCFMRDGTYRFNPARLSSAHATCFARFLGALDDGHPLVLVDNTNTTAVEIAPYVLAAQAKGYDHEILTFLVSESEAARRNVHGVPYEVIAAQSRRLAARVLPPYWNARSL